MRVLVGAILENRLVAIMALLDAQMEKLSSDGWPQRHDQACSQVDANVLPDIFTVVFPG
jgi:hypothetical protein